MRQEFGSNPDALIFSFTSFYSCLGFYGGFEYQLLDKGKPSAARFVLRSYEIYYGSESKPKIIKCLHQYSANLPQLLLDVDVQKAMAQNVDINEIYNTLGAQFGRAYINDFNKYGGVYRVMMQSDEDFRSKPEDISKVS